MLRLGVVSDIHWCPDHARDEYWHDKLDFAGVPDRLREALAYVGEVGADAVVLLGDLSHDGDDESHAAVLTACAESWPGAMFVVRGNHDLVDEVRDVGDIRLPVRVTKLPGAELSSPGPLVLLSHYPLVSQEHLFDARGFKFAGLHDGADELLAVLQARVEPTIVLCGHVHGRASCAEGDVLQLTFGALVEPPFECAAVEIEAEPNRLSVRRRSRRLVDAGEGPEPVFASADELWMFSEQGWACRTQADAEVIA